MQTFDESYVDWSGCELVVSIADIMHGQATIRGTRILADTIVQDFDLGDTIDQIQQNFPDLSSATIEQLIAFANSRQVQQVA